MPSNCLKQEGMTLTLYREDHPSPFAAPPQEAYRNSLSMLKLFSYIFLIFSEADLILCYVVSDFRFPRPIGKIFSKTRRESRSQGALNRYLKSCRHLKEGRRRFR